MSKKILTYILLLCIVVTTSCSDDSLKSTMGNNGFGELKGTLTLNVSTPDASVRTRTVDMEVGATVMLKNLWVGVFSIADGSCIGSKKYDDMNKALQSGVIFNKLITVDFVTLNKDFPLAYIVAVANYDGVKTWNGKKLEDILPDYDRHSSITWNDIINLDIDTESAYAGSKGENEHANAPFLAGFYQDAISQSQNPKIDQFAMSEDNPTAIYPEAAAEGMDIELGDVSDANIYVAAGALCLRRLISHNVVSINMSNGYEVSNVKIKRFNKPRVVYMLQRRTDTTRRLDFKEWQQNSPNCADHYLKEGQYDYTDAFPYANDEEWEEVELNTWDDRGHVELVFDHFENKHWGFGNLQSQGDREALNADGTFAALCNGEEDAYNNFASYFVLQMHIINKLTGESADVEYTLHEGFCNTDDGRRATTLADKCHDFGSFRNVNYTYNINISGISDIKASVTGDEGQEHLNGQSGTIWQMNYATGQSKTAIPIDGGIFDYGGKYISFSSQPDLGFRIYGRDESGNLVDVCYNMPDGMYEGFAALWPTGERTIITKSNLSSASISEKLLDEMQIGNYATGFHNVVDFIRSIEDGTIMPMEKFSIQFSKYDGTGLTGNYMRGLYIFDRNDIHNAITSDGSSYRIAYGAEQFPFEFEALTFDKEKIAWDNTFYRLASSVDVIHAATTKIFYGSEYSTIDLRWEHDERFLGYRISVFNDTYTHPTITVTAKKLLQYLQTVKGKTYFVYPLSTADFPPSGSGSAQNYSFSVTPIVDTDMYKESAPTYIRHKEEGNDATCIRVCPTTWNISSTTDWKTLNISQGNTITREVHYRGLHAYCPKNSADSNYGKVGSYLCFGGSGNVNNKYFSFWASVPGVLSVNCKSNGGDDPTRQLVVAKMNPEGKSGVDEKGNKYDIIYQSNEMPASLKTFSTALTLYNGQPTEFRFYAGTIQYYEIKFTPSN